MLRPIHLLALVLFASSAVFATEIPKDLAKKLISQSLEIPQRDISIAYILEGKAEVQDGFHADEMNLAVMIVPKLVNGRKIRKVKQYTFYWNEEFGWFCSFVRKGSFIEKEGKSEYIEIFSERGGSTVVK